MSKVLIVELKSGDDFSRGFALKKQPRINLFMPKELEKPKTGRTYSRQLIARHDVAKLPTSNLGNYFQKGAERSVPFVV